jgi:hypothetical protein
MYTNSFKAILSYWSESSMAMADWVFSTFLLLVFCAFPLSFILGKNKPVGFAHSGLFF